MAKFLKKILDDTKFNLNNMLASENLNPTSLVRNGQMTHTQEYEKWVEMMNELMNSYHETFEKINRKRSFWIGEEIFWIDGLAEEIMGEVMENDVMKKEKMWTFVSRYPTLNDFDNVCAEIMENEGVPMYAIGGRPIIQKLVHTAIQAKRYTQKTVHSLFEIEVDVIDGLYIKEINDKKYSKSMVIFGEKALFYNNSSIKKRMVTRTGDHIEGENMTFHPDFIVPIVSEL